MDQESVPEINDILPENLRFVDPKGKNDDGYSEIGVTPTEVRSYWGTGKKKVLRTAFTVGATLTGIGLLGGSSLLNGKKVDLPTLEQILIERLPTELVYSFKITDLKEKTVTFRVESGARTLLEREFEETGKYDGVLEVLESEVLEVSFVTVINGAEQILYETSYE